MHILLQVTDNCPTWISGSRNDHDRCCWTVGSNPRPLEYQSDACLTDIQGPAQIIVINDILFIKSALEVLGKIIQNLNTSLHIRNITYFLQKKTFDGLILFNLHDIHVIEPPHDKTIIYPVWLEASLCTQWEARDSRFLHADGEDWSD